MKLSGLCLAVLCYLSQVVNLMSVDLLRQQSRWKEALVSLREMMTSLIQQVHTCTLFSKWFYWVLKHQRYVLMRSEAIAVSFHNALVFRYKVNVNL